MKFVVVVGSHGDAGASIADVVLPAATYTEKNSIFVNTEGRAQETRVAVSPPGNARVDWKILRALSQVCDVTLPYSRLEEVRERLDHVAPHLLRLGKVEAANFFHEAVDLAQVRYHLPSSSLTPCPVKLALNKKILNVLVLGE